MRDGKVLFENKNIKNLLHLEGEEFIMNALFAAGSSTTIIPDLYYIGLDNRETVSVEDTLENLFVEPTSGGYERQPIASSGDFQISLENGHWYATTPLLAFTATVGGGGWGPIQNLFLTTAAADEGFLISSAKIGNVITISPGDMTTFQLSLSLWDFPYTS
jgi:hypothetical protein